MPNHCSNTLICTSGKNIGEILKPYISVVDEEGKPSEPHLDFQKIKPMPENPVVENKKYESLPDWYNWRVENWGTKWNSYSNSVYENVVEEQGGKIEDIDVYFFQTAWAPAIPVIHELAKITGESFNLYYYDEGHMFFGKATITPDDINDVEYADEEAADIDQEADSDIYEYCDLEFYLQCLEENEEDEE